MPQKAKDPTLRTMTKHKIMPQNLTNVFLFKKYITSSLITHIHIFGLILKNIQAIFSKLNVLFANLYITGILNI